MRPPPCGADIHAAVLKQACETYTTVKGSDKYTPFISSLIAEPPVHAPVVQLHNILPDSLLAPFFNENAMVGDIGSRLDELKTVNKRYSTVLGERDEFIRYLHRGDVLAQKLWQLLLVDQCVATMSVAAVHKSQGPQLRKILMCCPFNFPCKPISLLIGHEPHYGLRGVEALS